MKLKSFIYIQISLAILASMATLVACQKKEGHKNTLALPPVQMPNAGLSQSRINSGIQQSTSPQAPPRDLTKDCLPEGTQGDQIFVAPAETVRPMAGPGPTQSPSPVAIGLCLRIVGDASKFVEPFEKTSINYVGPITAAGTIVVSGNTKLGQCNIPPGLYTIEDSNGGLYNPVSFWIPEIIAVSESHRLILQIRNGIPRDVNNDFSIDHLILDFTVRSLQENSGNPISCLDSAGLYAN